MKKERFEFEYENYASVDELPEADAILLRRAKEATKQAYAPYSNFHVAAAARLANGEIISGTNQENASYPVGICAERVLLSAASAVYPDQPIVSIAVTYDSRSVNSDHPVAPCGMCRQALQEFEGRFQQPIRLIMGGMSGEIMVLPSTSHLLPFSFGKSELNG
jgi:cytidine deaminase